MKKFIIGIDIGGTNTKFGLINNSGKIISRASLDTKSYTLNKKKLIDAVIQIATDLIEENKLTKKNISAVGIGLPGLINPVAGVVKFLPNIPGWKNVPLKKIFQEKTGLPTFIDNDVNLITLGEWKFGAGRGYRNLICITLGTGVGGGLILNDALYRGEGFAAGEIGHMPLNEKGPQCNCGGYGCFECFVGKDYLLTKAGKIFKNKNIRLEEVFALADNGNIRAVQFWEEIATYIGNGLVGVVNFLNPQVIILGGGIINSFKFLREIINKIVQQRAMSVQAGMVKIVRSKLGDDAGLIGASVLISRQK